MSSNPSNIASSSITIMKLQMLLWIQSLCGSLPDFPMIASDKKLRTIAFLIQNPTVGNPDPSPTGQLARLRTLHRYCITVLGSAYEALSRKAELVNTIGQLEAMHPCHQKKALEVMNGGNIVRAYHLTDIAVPPWAPREDSIAPTEVDPSSDRDEDFDVDDEDTAEGEVSGESQPQQALQPPPPVVVDKGKGRAEPRIPFASELQAAPHPPYPDLPLHPSPPNTTPRTPPSRSPLRPSPGDLQIQIPPTSATAPAAQVTTEPESFVERDRRSSELNSVAPLLPSLDINPSTYRENRRESDEDTDADIEDANQLDDGDTQDEMDDEEVERSLRLTPPPDIEGWMTQQQAEALAAAEEAMAAVPDPPSPTDTEVEEEPVRPVFHQPAAWGIEIPPPPPSVSLVNAIPSSSPPPPPSHPATVTRTRAFYGEVILPSSRSVSPLFERPHGVPRAETEIVEPRDDTPTPLLPLPNVAEAAAPPVVPHQGPTSPGGDTELEEEPEHPVYYQPRAWGVRIPPLHRNISSTGAMESRSTLGSLSIHPPVQPLTRQGAFYDEPVPSTSHQPIPPPLAFIPPGSSTFVVLPRDDTPPRSPPSTGEVLTEDWTLGTSTPDLDTGTSTDTDEHSPATPASLEDEIDHRTAVATYASSARASPPPPPPTRNRLFALERQKPFYGEDNLPEGLNPYELVEPVYMRGTGIRDQTPEELEGSRRFDTPPPDVGAVLPIVQYAASPEPRVEAKVGKVKAMKGKAKIAEKVKEEMVKSREKSRKRVTKPTLSKPSDSKASTSKASTSKASTSKAPLASTSESSSSPVASTSTSAHPVPDTTSTLRRSTRLQTPAEDTKGKKRARDDDGDEEEVASPLKRTRRTRLAPVIEDEIEVDVEERPVRRAPARKGKSNG